MKIAALFVFVSLISIAFTVICLLFSNSAESFAIALAGSFLIGWFFGDWFLNKVFQ